VNPENYKNIPIKYLEVGAFYGANAISVANTYAAHPESELHLVDPWEDYSEYPEYKTEQPKIHDQFLRNIESSGAKDKMKIHRGFSNVEIPQFADEYFDIIYIDGNHEPEFVMEDAVLSFRKLKKDGIMIFDDYGWGGPDLTQRGIDGFLSGYHKRIRNLGTHETQVFLQKLS
jgi:predicted O-methyltransferase YrrM